MKISLLSFLVAIACPASAQWGGIQDSNPSNPANWNLNFASNVSGTDTVVSWAATPSPHEVTTTYDWATESHLVQPAKNNTGQSRTVSYSSRGTITKRIRWIGFGHAPNKVLVRVGSAASYSFKNGGSGSADNGLGTPTAVLDNGLVTVGEASASNLRYLNVDPSGEAVFEVAKDATATSAGPASQASADANNLQIEIADRECAITPWVSPTYTAAHNDAPIPIVNLDPTNARMNVGIYYQEGNAEGFVTGEYTDSLWGPWNGPASTWGFADRWAYWGKPMIDRVFSRQRIAEIAENGPETVTQTLSVTDRDGVTRNATLTVKMYAPQQFPAITSSERVYDNWARVSGLVHRDPNATTSITNSVAHARMVTKTIKVEGNLGGIPIFGKDSPLVLALKLEGQYSETAVVTKTNTITYAIDSGSDDKVFWIVKRNFWLEKRGLYSAYGPNGYEGIRNLFLICWESPTKEMAELQDHEHDLESQRIIP